MKNLDPNQPKISVAKAQEMKLDHLQAPLDGKVDNTFGIKVFKQSFIIFKNCSDLLVAAASNGKIQVGMKSWPVTGNFYMKINSDENIVSETWWRMNIE